MPECLPALGDTIACWSRAHGIERLTMSPTLYNRGGKLEDHRLASAELRRMIRLHGLRSQALDFGPSAAEIFRQWQRNRFGCIPRNVDRSSPRAVTIFTATTMSRTVIRSAMSGRTRWPRCCGAGKGMAAAAALCEACNMRHRYGPLEAAGCRARSRPARLREG